MCSDCGSREPGRRYAVDGTSALLCADCVRDARRISAAHEDLRRIHRAAHGYDRPCPTCQADAWLAGQLALERLEASIARAQQPMAFDAEGTLLP